MKRYALVYIIIIVVIFTYIGHYIVYRSSLEKKLSYLHLLHNNYFDNYSVMIQNIINTILISYPFVSDGADRRQINSIFSNDVVDYVVIDRQNNVKFSLSGREEYPFSLINEDTVFSLSSFTYDSLLGSSIFVIYTPYMRSFSKEEVRICLEVSVASLLNFFYSEFVLDFLDGMEVCALNSSGEIISSEKGDIISIVDENLYNTIVKQGKKSGMINYKFNGKDSRVYYYVSDEFPVVWLTVIPQTVINRAYFQVFLPFFIFTFIIAILIYYFIKMKICFKDIELFLNSKLREISKGIISPSNMNEIVIPCVPSFIPIFNNIIFYIHTLVKNISKREEFFHTLMEISSSAIITIDHSLKIEYFNRQATEICPQCKKGDYIFSHEVFKKLKENIEIAISKGMVMKDIRYEENVCGIDRIFSVSLKPLKYGGGGIIIQMDDITSIEKIKDEILKARNIETIRLMIDGISHDFNNILAGILGNTEKLSFLIGDSNLRQLTNNIYTYIEDAKGLINRLKKIVYPDQIGKDRIKKIKVSEVMDNMLNNELKILLEGINIEKDFRFNGYIMGDLYLIKQSFIEVLKNSVQALTKSRHKRIRVSIEERERDDKVYCVVSIEDNGEGIPQSIKDKILLPFFTTRERDHIRGKGMGLSMVDSIMKMHGGFVKIASYENIGTIVSLYFPIK